MQQLYLEVTLTTTKMNYRTKIMCVLAASCTILYLLFGVARHEPQAETLTETLVELDKSVRKPIDLVQTSTLKRLYSMKRKVRETIGTELEIRGYTKGVELGVQEGKFSKEILERWPSCKKYVLVDILKQQKTYVDSANVGDNIQEATFQSTLQRVPVIIRRYAVILLLFVQRNIEITSSNSFMLTQDTIMMGLTRI